MQKFAALALTAALGLAGVGYAKSADAGVVVGVGVGLPGPAWVAPPVYAYPPAVGLYAPYYGGWPSYGLAPPGFRPLWLRLSRPWARLRHGYGHGRR